MAHVGQELGLGLARGLGLIARRGEFLGALRDRFSSD